jgi:hypothetical protein
VVLKGAVAAQRVNTTISSGLDSGSEFCFCSHVPYSDFAGRDMPDLDFVRGEIEHMRVQVTDGSGVWHVRYLPAMAHYKQINLFSYMAFPT